MLGIALARSLFFVRPQHEKKKEKGGERPAQRSRGTMSQFEYTLYPTEKLFFAKQEQQRSRSEKDDVYSELMKKYTAKSLPCQRCHRCTVTFSHKQTRSVDEGMTSFFACTSCGFQWKD